MRRNNILGGQLPLHKHKFSQVLKQSFSVIHCCCIVLKQVSAIHSTVLESTSKTTGEDIIKKVKQEFSLSSLPKIQILTITHEQNVFVEVQESNGKVKAHYWKKDSRLDTLKEEEEQFHFTRITLPQGDIAQCQRDLISNMKTYKNIQHIGKGKYIVRFTIFQYCNMKVYYSLYYKVFKY